MSFVAVPKDVRDQGAPAANAYIKAQLPKPPSVEALTQQAALFSFRLADGKITVAPEEGGVDDAEAARDFFDEARRKAQVLR